MTTPFRQLESVTSYVADGVQTAWNFTFSSGYLSQAHVKAYTLSPLGVRAELTLNTGMFTGPFQLTLTPPVAAGYELTIYRATPTDTPLVDFTDKAALTEVDLDTVVKQAVFSAAETQDALGIASARIDQIGAFADAANTSKLAAATSAGQAATSATNAANQVTLAAAQVALAAGQVSLATDQANLAAGSASAAATSLANMNDTLFVHRAGAETITGVKTHSAAPVFNAGFSSNNTAPVFNAGAAFNTVAPSFGVQPTGLVKATVGLGNVDNTADTAKPISTAQAAVNALMVNQSELQRQVYTAFNTGGTSTAYTLTPTPVAASYVVKQSFVVTFHTTCGANPTLNISGLGATLTLVKLQADGLLANLVAGDIVTGHMSRVTLLSTTQALVETMPNRAFGAGVTFSSVLGSRALATTYTNTLKTPIWIWATCSQPTANYTQLTVDGSLVQMTGNNSGITINCTICGMIPAGSTYKVDSTGTLANWFEMKGLG